MTNFLEGFMPFMNYGGTPVIATARFEGVPKVVRNTLEPQLVEVAARGFKRQVTPEFSQDVSGHLRGGDLLVAMANGRPCAFAVRTFMLILNAVYLAGAVKDPSQAPSRVIEAMTEHYIKNAAAKVVVTRTQNDRVVEIMRGLSPGGLVPLDRPATNDELLILHKVGLTPLAMPFNRERLVLEGYYGTPMIQGERKRSKDSRVRALTDQLIYERGDAQVLLGYTQQALPPISSCSYI